MSYMKRELEKIFTWLDNYPVQKNESLTRVATKMFMCFPVVPSIKAAKEIYKLWLKG